MHTFMAMDVLEVISVLWNNPCVAGSVVLFFITSLCHLVLFFSPLLISTALCVIALISIGPQIEKIREERERQFKLVGLSLRVAENERPFNRYLVFRRGRHRPPQGRGRGERWTDWVSGVEIRGQSIWLSESQLMVDIAEENLKTDFRDGEGGIKMIQEDTSCGGALAFASAENNSPDLSSFHNLVPSFRLEMYDSPLIQHFPEKIDYVEHAESSLNVCEVLCQTKSSIAGCDGACRQSANTTFYEDDGTAVHAGVLDATEKTSRVFGEGIREPVFCLNEADTFCYTPSTRISSQPYPTHVRFARIAEDALLLDVCSSLSRNLQNPCEKQNEPFINAEPSSRNKHNKSVSLLTEKGSAPSSSKCGCFNKPKFSCLFKSPPETRLKHDVHSTSA